MGRIASKGEAMRLYQRGWPLGRIANELGVEVRSVRRSLERAGVRFRDQRPAIAAPEPREPECDLDAAMPAFQQLVALAAAVRDFAAERLYSNPVDPAAQELMIAAKQAKEFAGDCLFYAGLSLRIEAQDPYFATSPELAALRRVIAALAARREALAGQERETRIGSSQELGLGGQ